MSGRPGPRSLGCWRPPGPEGHSRPAPERNAPFRFPASTQFSPNLPLLRMLSSQGTSHSSFDRKKKKHPTRCPTKSSQARSFMNESAGRR